MVKAIAEFVGKTENPWCSLITVTHNSRLALEEFWGRNDKRPVDVEWIVVDNASTDGSADFAESLGARVIRLPENLGFASSNNAGLKVAGGDLIGFVNPDLRVKFSDLSLLAKIACERKAIVSPQLLNADGSLQPNGRGFPFLWDKIKNRLGAEEKLRGRYLLFGEADAPRSVCWLMGASVFGSRETIEKFGAWDPYFFLYYEDKDFCLRAWKASVPVLLVPSSAWTHGWARETSRLSAMPWKREFVSMFKFYRRYPEFLMPKAVASRKHPRINHEVYGAEK